MNWSASVPYNDLPDLPPQVGVESRAVLKAVVEARAALAALEQASVTMPNPAVLVNSIPLLEAQASSEIENIVTTTDELFKFAADETAASDPATREALRYRSALTQGFRAVSGRPVTAALAADVCSIIKMREMSVRIGAGTFIGNPTTQTAVYTPPVGADLITTKLTNWETFLHSAAGLDPLVVMAMGHYQFEAIHPFDDGNGRTGRVLNVLTLVEEGLLTQPVLYLSRYIIRHKADYYSHLQGVTEHAAWEPWLLFMLEGIRQTAQATVLQIAAIRELQVEVHESLRKISKTGVNADLLAVLFEQPYCRISTVVDRCSVSRPTATNWLNELLAAGLVTEERSGRERLFINARFLEILADGSLDPSFEGERW